MPSSELRLHGEATIDHRPKMKAIRRTAQFKRDVKRTLRRGRNAVRLKRAPESPVAGQGLTADYRDHVLVGQFKGTRERYLEPSWLLIYQWADS